MQSKTLMLGKPMFYETVSVRPEHYLDIAYDSRLEIPPVPGQNCKLRITLRMFYHQINPPQITAAMMRIVCAHLNVPIPVSAVAGWYPDANNSPQLIRNWTSPEWNTFTSTLLSQAQKWDGQYWLVPPNEFSLFDVVDQRGSRFRPNVKCEFKLELAPSKYGAHRTIDVVNLATHNFFRSHATLYDSDDIIPSGSLNQLAGAHETGHALGLSHVAAIRNRPNCGFAILLAQNNLPFDPVSYPQASYGGGINSSVCYGDPTYPADANNIMGAGMDFDPEDAQPWLDRLPEHLNLTSQDRFEFGFNRYKWKVVKANLAPRVVH